MTTMKDKLLTIFKAFGKWESKVTFQDELYSLRVRKDKSPYADMALGRDSLIKSLMNNISDDKLQEALDNNYTSGKEFVDSLKSNNVNCKEFLKVAHNFSNKYSRGCMNTLRHLLIYHLHRSEDNNIPLVFKNKQVNIKDKFIQKRFYSYLLLKYPNDTAFRLALAISNHYRYKHIDFEHFVNSISYNYNNLTKKEMKIVPYNDSKRKVYGILKDIISFSLYLYVKKVYIRPLSWMHVPTSYGSATYHLHRSVYDKDFQLWLNTRYNINEFKSAMEYGLIMNPWELVMAEWKDYNNQDEKESFKWSFIKDTDVNIERFGLSRV